MGERRILRIAGGELSVAREARFASEDELHEAIAAHPEVLPSEDIGLGPLSAIASKVTLESWELDLLAVDPRGRLAIIEFKRGTENPDVRKVIAQVLDYGSLLWGRSYDELSTLCKTSIPFGGTLVDHVGEQLTAIGHEGFDPATFEDGVTANLAAGQFVFMYVARDLDARTRRIMTYLAEGPRMAFFAVEVDCFREPASSATVLVPRTAFVPSWVTETQTGSMAATRVRRLLREEPEEVQRLVRLMDDQADNHRLISSDTATGRAYRFPPNISAVGIYWGSGRGIEFNLDRFRTLGAGQAADELLQRFSAFLGRTITATKWPTIPLHEAAARAEEAIEECVQPYLAAAEKLAEPDSA
jgi:hypothetical protein